MRIRASVRYDKEAQCFRLRCEDCRVYVVLDNERPSELWIPAKGMRRCRACWQQHDRELVRELRKNPEKRARESAYTKQYEANMTQLERFHRQEKARIRRMRYRKKAA